MRTNQGFGWRRDLPDHRDFKFVVPVEIPPLPESVQLESQYGDRPVYAQGDLGSCTANAIAGALMFTQIKEKDSPVIFPSRLFIYYAERVIEETIASDSGAELRDGLKVVSNDGFPQENLWPYIVEKFTITPPASVYSEALKSKVVLYRRIDQNLDALRLCLYEGFPFVFGISVYDSFMGATDGAIKLPSITETLLGGHAILCTGYDNVTQRFTFRNSWGTGWGKNGSGTLPYEYLTNPSLASDFWTIRKDTQV